MSVDGVLFRTLVFLTLGSCWAHFWTLQSSSDCHFGCGHAITFVEDQLCLHLKMRRIEQK